MPVVRKRTPVSQLHGAAAAALRWSAKAKGAVQIEVNPACANIMCWQPSKFRQRHAGKTKNIGCGERNAHSSQKCDHHRFGIRSYCIGRSRITGAGPIVPRGRYWHDRDGGSDFAASPATINARRRRALDAEVTARPPAMTGRIHRRANSSPRPGPDDLGPDALTPVRPRSSPLRFDDGEGHVAGRLEGGGRGTGNKLAPLPFRSGCSPVPPLPSGSHCCGAQGPASMKRCCCRGSVPCRKPAEGPGSRRSRRRADN